MSDENIYALMKTLNQLYGVGPSPRKLATPPAAELIINRFRALTPGHRNLVTKALRGSPDLPQFAIYGTFKAAGGDAQRPTVEAVLSTSEVDFDSDRMSENALKQMATGFKGLTVFLNHHYAWPEDVFGTCMSTALAKSKAITALTASIAVETANARAVQSWEQMKHGTRAGVSVGVLVLASHYEDGPKPGTRKILVIDDVLPLEASICGLPACPSAWITVASAAVKSTSSRR